MSTDRRNSLDSVLGATPGLPVAVQEHFLRDARYSQELLSNKNLDSGIVARELGRRHSEEEIRLLVSRELTEEQWAHMVMTDKRYGVLEALITDSRTLGKVEIEALIKAKVSHAMLEEAYTVVRGDATLADMIGKELKGKARLGWLGDRLDFDANLLGEAIGQLINSQISETTKIRTLVEFFDLQPEALRAVIRGEHPQMVYEAAARSISLNEDDQAYLLGFHSAAEMSTQGSPSRLAQIDGNVAMYLVENIVTSTATLKAIERLVGGESISNALAGRRDIFTHEVGASLSGVNNDSVEAVLSQLNRSSMFENNYEGVAATRVAWLYYILQNVSVESRERLLPWFYHARLLNTLGPIRHRRLYDVLVASGFINGDYTTELSDDYIPNEGKALRLSDTTLEAPASVEMEYTLWELNACDVGATLIERFGTNIDKWEMYSKLVCNSGESPIKDVIRVVEKLVR